MFEFQRIGGRNRRGTRARRETAGTSTDIVGLTREPGGVLVPRWMPPGLVCLGEVDVQNETSRRGAGARLHDVGETLRSSWHTPTDTMITEDIPTLLTRLSQVPKTRKKP